MEKKISYYDKRENVRKEERHLTEAEYNSRLGDLRMMALGGHVSDIIGEDEA